MTRAVARVGSPVLLTGAMLVATVAFADGLTPNGSPEWLIPVLLVQGIGVLVNLGVVSWMKWSVERIADKAAFDAVSAHNDRGDAHLVAAPPGQKSVRDALHELERDVDQLRRDVQDAKNAVSSPRDPMDSPHPRRGDDPDTFDGRRMRGRQ